MEPKTKAARVRDVLPAIEQKVAEGVRIADIVRTLNNAGLELTVGTLKSYLSRHRRTTKATSSPAQPGGRPVEASIPREALSPNPAAESQRIASDAGIATMPARASGADCGPSRTEPDAAASVPTAAASPQLACPAPAAAIGVTDAHTARSECTADPDVEDQAMPLHGSGSGLSVHDALIAARKRVAATD